MYKKIIFILIFLIFTSGISNAQTYKIGDLVENFTLPSAIGDSISLYDYWGQVILIHIWHYL